MARIGLALGVLSLMVFEPLLVESLLTIVAALLVRLLAAVPMGRRERTAKQAAGSGGRAR